MTRPACSRRCLRRIVLAVLLAGVVVAYNQRHSLLTAAGRSLNVSSPLQEPVDYVMVLGGWPSTRPFVTAEIVRAGLAEKVLVPRFEESDEVRKGIVPSENEAIRQVLLRSGVAPDAIVLLDSVVDSTQSEARVLAEFLNQHPGAHVAVVTSDYHTRRTRLLFSRACGNRAGNLRYIGAPTDDFDASNWWQFECGVVNYLTEYLKLTRALVS
jgi:uncharacterized SAM-binding protein YcdF (DUF218 family)